MTTGNNRKLEQSKGSVQIEANIRKASEIYQRGVLIEKEGKPEEAFEFYKKAIALESNNPEYLASAGNTAEKLGLNDEAVRYYWKAIDAAIKDKNYNKIDEYNNEILEIRRTTPQWAKEITEKASRLPDTPEIKEALIKWKRLNTEIEGLIRTFDYKQAEEKLTIAIEITRKSFGENHPYHLTSLKERGGCYFDQGRYADAEKLFQVSLERRKAVLGDRHPETLESLGSFAAALAFQGRYSEAEPLYQNALKLRITVLGENHLDTITSLVQLAVLYWLQGRYAEAESLYLKALKRETIVLGEKHPRTLLIMSNLAGAYLSQGRYTETELLMKKVLKLSISVQGERHPNTLSFQNDMALLHQSQGRYTEAESLYQKVLELRIAVLGEKHPDTLASLHNLAALYCDQGRYTEAESLYQKALELSIAVLGEKHLSTLWSLDNLAFVYQSQGRYAEAEPLYQRTLKLRTAILGENHPATMSSLNSLESLYSLQGRYDEAETLIQKALKVQTVILGEKHPDTMTSLINLASLYQSQDRYTEAEPLSKKSLKLSTELLGERHPTTLTCLNNLARLYESQGRYNEAESLHQKALKLISEILGETHPHTMLSMRNLAGLYTIQKRYPEAESLYQKALKLQSEILGETHPATVNTLGSLAFLYLVQGQVEKFEPLSQKYLRMSNQFLESVLWGAGEATRQSYLKQQEVNRDMLLSFYLFKNSSEMSEEAFYFSLTRKGLLLRIASEINAVTRSGSHPELAGKALQLQQKKQQLSNLTLSGPGDKDPKAHQQSLKQLEGEIHALEATLGREVQQLSRAKTQVTPQVVVQALQSDEVLIDFLTFKRFDWQKLDYSKEHLIVLIVDKTAGQSFRIIDLGNLDPISDLVKQFREQLKNPDEFSSEELKLTSQNLYRKLWQPLSVNLKGKKKVYIVPDGVLHLLPFSTLQDGNGQYLSESRELVVLSSGRDLVVPLSTGNIKDPAVLSSPYFDQSQVKEYASVRSKQKRTVASRAGDLYFTPLPGTAIEGDQITRMWRKQGKKPSYFAYETATEQNLKSVTAPRVLHLATHGFFLDAVPTQKGVGNDLKRGVLMPVTIDTTASQSAVHSTKSLSGVLITEVITGYQGESAGLMVGDRIIRYAGEKILSVKGLTKLSQGMKGYKDIEMVFLRKNEEKTVHLVGGTIGVKVANTSDYSSTKTNPNRNPIKKEENPLLRSGLALTGANEGVKANFSSKEDDGIFTALEALGLDLNGTELVVLSACETGVGSIKQGEGVYGLRRAFQEAGAHAVLSTLWTISDEGTQVFMEKFYTRFLNGEKPQTALRNTQLEFMHSEDWNHPFYWAPFVMVGKE